MFCAWMHGAAADSKRESLPPNAPETGQNAVSHRRCKKKKGRRRRSGALTESCRYTECFLLTQQFKLSHSLRLMSELVVFGVRRCRKFVTAVLPVHHFCLFFFVKFTFCDLFTCVFGHLLFPFCFSFHLRTSIWCVRRSTQNVCPLHNAVSNYSFYLLCRASLIPTSVSSFVAHTFSCTLGLTCCVPNFVGAGLLDAY